MMTLHVSEAKIISSYKIIYNITFNSKTKIYLQSIGKSPCWVATGQARIELDFPTNRTQQYKVGLCRPLNWDLGLGLVHRVITFSTRCLKLDSSNLWYLENMWSTQRSDSLLLSPSSCSRSSSPLYDCDINIRSLGAKRPWRSRVTWPLRVSRILRISNIIKLSRWLSISTNLASRCHLWHYVC